MELTSYDIQLLREELAMLASITRAKARIEGMLVANEQREKEGQSLAYTEDAFTAVIDEEGIDYNTVISNLWHKV